MHLSIHPSICLSVHPSPLWPTHTHTSYTPLIFPSPTSALRVNAWPHEPELRGRVRTCQKMEINEEVQSVPSGRCVRAVLFWFFFFICNVSDFSASLCKALLRYLGNSGVFNNRHKWLLSEKRKQERESESRGERSRPCGERKMMFTGFGLGSKCLNYRYPTP